MMVVIQFACSVARELLFPAVLAGPSARVPVRVAGPSPGFLEKEFPELEDMAGQFDLLRCND